MSRCHSVHHCMPHELSWNHTWSYSDRLATNNLSHGMVPPMSYMIKTVSVLSLFVISYIIEYLPAYMCSTQYITQPAIQFTILLHMNHG